MRLLKNPLSLKFNLHTVVHMFELSLMILILIALYNRDKIIENVQYITNPTDIDRNKNYSYISSMPFIAADEQSIKQALKNIKRKYGEDKAKNIERMARLETNHFKSGGWKATHSFGMHPVAYKFPYGWSSLKSFWMANPQFAPIDVIDLKEGGTNKVKPYLVFPTAQAGFESMAYLLQIRKWDYGSWYSNNESSKNRYIKKMSTITPTILNND